MAPHKEKKRANLRDVARIANVSVATVSRVLNTPKVVQQDTRERVEAAITELGFHPSAAARAINSGRTRIIGALIPTLESDIFALTLDAIESRLDDFGLSLVVATTDEDADKEARKAKELLDVGVEGLILSGISHSDALHSLIERTRVPAIVTSYYDATFRYPTIGYDNHGAARLALDHLQDLGHRQVAVIHGPAAINDRIRERLRALIDPQDGVSLKYYETEFSVAGGAAVIDRVLTKQTQLDAILCLSDVQAFGALFALQRRGVNVPQDVSVMGLQDLPSAAQSYPSLSTVRLPARRMGRLAAESLAKWVEDDHKPDPTCLPCELIVRESTTRKH